MNRQILLGIFRFLAAAGVAGLVLVVLLTDPWEDRSRWMFYWMVLLATTGGIGLLSERTLYRPNRRWRNGPWLGLSVLAALLLTSMVVFFSERPENAVPGSILLVAAGGTLYWWWSKKHL